MNGQVTKENCADEPIHIPGSIQPHGVLLAARESDSIVTQVSSNTAEFLGREPAELLGQPIASVFREEVRDVVEKCLADAVLGVTNPWQLLADTPDGPRFFDGISHRGDGKVIIELENPADRDRAQDPLRRAVDPYFHLVRQTLSETGSPDSVEETCQVLCREVKRFTGFDRVMVYRFAEDGHGEVIGEALSEGMEPYLGLHYPESDIPAQARRLYALSWVRLIPDAAYEPVLLEPPFNPETNLPLDLSHSVLRSVSPMHTEYLQNMGVGASMSISLLRGDALWGLIACHHREPRHVPYEVRAACVMLGAVMSANLVSKEEAARARRTSKLQAIHTKLVNAVGSSGSIPDGLTEADEDLLGLVGADGVTIFFDSDMRSVGMTPEPKQVRLLKEWLDENQPDVVFETDSLAERWPAAAEFAGEASGLISLKFWPDDYILFFRPEQRRAIRWAGDPDKAHEFDEDGRLHPRSSFAEFVRQVKNRSAAWDATELAVASDFQRSVGGFIQQRNEELMRLNQQLLEKNEEIEQLVYSVSHDLKSPLVTARGFIGLLREDIESGDREAVLDSAGRIERASDQMSRLIDDLLEHSRIGRREVRKEDVDVDQLLRRLGELYEERLEAVGADFVIEPDVPRVYAAEVDLERIFDNLISNALKYGCEETGSRIEIGGVDSSMDTRFFVRDNGPGIEPEYHEKIFGLFQRLHADKDGTGVGLASVSKIMQTYRGKVWVDSVHGEGATFWFAFPKRKIRRGKR